MPWPHTWRWHWFWTGLHEFSHTVEGSHKGYRRCMPFIWVTSGFRLGRVVYFAFSVKACWAFEVFPLDYCGIYGRGNINPTALQWSVSDLYLPSFSRWAICKPVLSALAYLHRWNIIHRDVKAESIFLSSTSGVKLGDFGFCVEVCRASLLFLRPDTFFVLSLLQNTRRDRVQSEPYTGWHRSSSLKSHTRLPLTYGPSVLLLWKWPNVCRVSLTTTWIRPRNWSPPIPNHILIDRGRWATITLMSNFVQVTLLSAPQHSEYMGAFLAQTLIRDPQHRPTAEHLLQDIFITSCVDIACVQEFFTRIWKFDSFSRELFR